MSHDKVVHLHRCPTCKALPNEPCKTPKGRKKQNVHETRPISLFFSGNKEVTNK